MLIHLKKLFPLLILLNLLLSFPIAQAQPTSGIKLGVKSTFIDDTQYFNFGSKFGFEGGYEYVFNLQRKWSLSAAGIIEYHVSSISFTDEVPVSILGNTDYKCTFISLPLLVHYGVADAFMSLGYKYGYKLTGTLPANEHNHSLVAGVGYSLRYFDVGVQYNHTLNEQTLSSGLYGDGVIQYPAKGVKLQSISVAITIPLGGNNK